MQPRATISRDGTYVVFASDWGEETGTDSCASEDSLGQGDPYIIELIENRKPSPGIKANGSDGPLTISQRETLKVTVFLNPGSYSEKEADWWVYATTSFGTYWYTLDSGWVPSSTPIRVYGGPLFSLGPYTILEMSTLPIGDYVFNFEVDDNMDNVRDGAYGDSVKVTIE